MRHAFCTCVQLGLSCLEEAVASGLEFELFITLTDDLSKNKSGRVYLDEIASTTETPLLKIYNINDVTVQEHLKKYDIDWLFLIGWSQIAHEQVLLVPKQGVIGMHPTLLPIGRGRASVPWAILKGLEKTGVTAFKLDAGVDTGPIVDQVSIDLNPRETATTLYEKVDIGHKLLMKSVCEKILSKELGLTVQDESLATLWPGRTPADGELSKDMPVITVDRLVRATTKPYPGAFIIFESKKLVIWEGFVKTDSLQQKRTEICLTFSDGIFVATRWEFED